jgi:hypothetical protein
MLHNEQPRAPDVVPKVRTRRKARQNKEKVNMSRSFRFFAIVIAVMMLATSAMAQTANQRLEGMMGIGFFNSDAPVGVRYWMNDGMAVDFGVNLNVQNNQAYSTATSTETTSFFDYAFDIGLPIVMHGEENMIVYFRPGATIIGNQDFDPSVSADAGDKAYETTFRGELALGGEFFLSQLGWPNLSFSGQVGVGVDFVSPRDSDADSSVMFSTSSTGVDITQSANAGFRIYFN